MTSLRLDRDMNYWWKFHRDEEAATSIEYCVVLFFIITMCIVGITALGNSNNGLWGRNSSELMLHM